jgi:Protein of unknown function (DUF4229)
MSEPVGERRPRSTPFLFAIYTGSRIALFAVVLAALLLIGLRGFIVLVAALAISGIASFVLLGRQRTAFGAAVEAGVERRRAARSAALAAEDAAGDTAESAG